MGLVTLGEIRGLLVNNGLCSEAGKFFLDAAYGKNLQDQLTKLNSDSFHYKGTITTGDDLNNYKTIGCYRYNGKPSNTPSSTSDWGELCVFKSDNYIVQTAFAGLSRMFSRHVDPPSGIWTQWIEYAPKSDLGEWGGYKIIKTGVTDLNNPPSAFIIQTIAGTSIPGYPSGFGGNTVLALQLYPGRSDYGAQLAFSFGMDKIAIRRKSESTTWSDWKYFTAS